MRPYINILVLVMVLLVGSCVQTAVNVLTTGTPEPSRTTGTTRSSGYYGQNAYQKAQREAYAAQGERGDNPEAIRIWEQALAQYDSQNWPFTRASICSNIAQLYVKEKDYGKALGYAEQSDKLLDVVEKIGVVAIDDDGYGVLDSSKEPEYRNFGGNKERMFDAWRTTNDSVRMQYYRAAGESDKADDIGRKMAKRSEKQVENTYEATKKTYIDSLRVQAKYDKTLTEAEIERRAEEQAQASLRMMEETQRAMQERTALRAEIFRRSMVGEGGIEELIDRFVEIVVEQNPTGPLMYENNAKNAEKSGQAAQIAQARDYRRLGDYHRENVSKPWGMAVKATLLLDVNRPQEALRFLDQALAKIKSPAPMPQVETDFIGSYWQTMMDQQSFDLIAWRFLRAQILTRMNDPRAIVEWDRVIDELNRPAIDVSSASQAEKQAAIMSNIMREAILGDRYQELAASEIASLYENVGKQGEGIRYIDNLLKTRETARASFSVEAHKRGYLAANKRLYERYLALSTNDPGVNLLGMERAKSRAMVDLMAGGIENINDPTLQMVAMYRQAAASEAGKQAQQRKTRAIAGKELDKGLKELKRNAPELHSLISVDVAGANQLAALLGPDAVALSYYVSDDALYINVIGQGIREVEVVPVSKSAMFGAVYDYRQKLLDPSSKYSRKSGKVTVDWNVDKGTQRLTVSNGMPFPLEINGISALYRSYAGGAHFPYLPMGYSMQVAVTADVQSIPAGKKAVIYEEEQYGGDWSYSNYIENYIETNLGTAFASGMLITEAGKDDSLIVIEERGFSYTPLKQSLYDVLIKPVRQYIGNKQLIIVPHSVLHFLPFETLKGSDGKYLIETNAVSYTPSLNALRLCRTKNRGRPTRLVAYSDPLGDLSFARQEVNTVRTLFDESVVLTGEQVTAASVESTMGQGDVVHFACHGIFNPASPLDSALVMASGSQGQSLGRLKMEDLNLLTVGDIMRLKSNPCLVFLSACDTGRARVSGGDELIGLVRGFFVAGSPSLVTTLWPIDDQSTALLAVRFYENLLKRNMDKSQALQEAKLYLMKNGYGDPYYWAAFVLQGDWR
ncbi:CHAT domain-containing protein [Pseudodesulfovibrio sp. zrk46]|uniref:CHAT domain-containing protein n=1 Tax=Pseudodesulfovibrio sp. zrk46 TaxID=2725288 RepID=UPI001449D6D7|nr:CHAT domain-containing protein [Pseudodesulfovibrio sp. zrk46]QJB57058.1 CHAT domain-containing protein [Pseudodesulfovibrio sp. zrk46]